MAMNDSREEKARLDRREFDLDTEEQERQRKERDAMIVKVCRHPFCSLKTKHFLKRYAMKPQHRILCG